MTIDFHLNNCKTNKSVKKMKINKIIDKLGLGFMWLGLILKQKRRVFEVDP